MGKPLDPSASFRTISLTSCISKLFERIILCRLLFFLESNSILTPCQTGFRPERSTLDEILFLPQPISDGFNKPRLGSRFSLLSIFQKLSTRPGTPPFFTNLIRLASLLALLVGINLFFLTGALAWFIKSQKYFFSSPSRCSARFRSWPCTFLSLHQ